MPNDVIVNNALVDYRFHGTPALYKTPYTIDFMEQVAQTIKSKRKSKEVFMFFNNDIDVNAPHNAGQMQEITGKRIRSVA